MAEATLLLINSTIYDFQLSYQHQYQMENWDFPALIATGKSAQIPIGFHHGLYSMDDGAEATYSLKGGSSQFTLQARAPDRDFRLYFDGSDLQNDGHLHPRELLGWTVNQKLVLWISGTNTGYVVRHFWR
jgi:hypothetical protein